VQQGLVAHGDVQEDLVDSLAQPGLVDGGGDGRACTVPNDSAIRETSWILLLAGGGDSAATVHVIAPPELFDHAR
jgi:hypothetical protein